MSSFEHYTELSDGTEIIIEFEVTSWGSPASYWEPADPVEWDITDVREIEHSSHYFWADKAEIDGLDDLIAENLPERPEPDYDPYPDREWPEVDFN